MRTVSRKWDWISAARKTIAMYEELLDLPDYRSPEMFLENNTTKRACAYCKATHERAISSHEVVRCQGCIQFYIHNAAPEGPFAWCRCIRFSSYRNVARELQRMKPNPDAILARIEFHQRIIEFLMGVPEYATDAYIFEKIANLELE